MKAILIDAINKEVKEVEIDEEKDFLDQAYALIGCTTIEGVDFDETGENFGYVDEEGMLKQPKHFFTIENGWQPYAGNCLIVGTDDEGGNTDVSYSMTVEKVRGMVEFKDLYQVKAML